MKFKIIIFICIIILATQISSAFAEENTQLLNNTNEDMNNKLKIQDNINNFNVTASSGGGGKILL